MAGEEKDFYATKVLKMYRRFHTDKRLKIGFVCVPIVLIMLFIMLISSKVGNFVVFGTFLISIVFIIIALGILGWIMEKDTGSEAMVEIADSIREGADGFFVT